MPGNRDGSTGWRGPLRRLPQPTIRTIQNATQCNTMQHNAHSPLRIQSEGTPGVASRDCLKKGRSPTGSGPLGRLPPHYEANPICPATNDSHDSKCNTMQHNATQCLLASPMQSDGTRSCRIPRLSQKRAQPDRSNETQCNAMQRQIEVSKCRTAVPCKTSTARVRAVTLSPASPSRRPLHPQVLSTGPQPSYIAMIGHSSFAPL